MARPEAGPGSDAFAEPLPAREAYRRWAERYETETVVSALEREAVARVTPPLAGLSLLDAGCGTGRRLPAGSGAARVVGADLVPAMLAAGRGRLPEDVCLAAADFRALPFRDGVFDVVWCRLAIGHVADPGPVFTELGRVARAGARLIVSDFHPAAVRAGHARTFRDAAGRLLAVEHHLHDVATHAASAVAAGWRTIARQDVAVGPEIRRFYERAGRMNEYERQVGLPLVLLLCYSRRAGGRASDARSR